MPVIGKLNHDVELARRELKNIRQELRKQKAEWQSEILKIKDFLSQKKKLQKGSDKTSEETFDPRYSMHPIGFISSCFNYKNGIPRQPLLCPAAKGTLKIEKSVFTNPDHSLIGLDDFSHVWILFVFHQNGEYSSFKAKVHPPRLNGSSVGVFSTRSPHRPSPIGLSLIKLDRIEGDTLFLSGLDLLNGTPVLDIKPYISMYDTPCYFKDEKQSNTLKDFLGCSESRTKKHSTLRNDRCEVQQSILEAECAVAPYLKQPQPECLEVIFTCRATTDLKMLHSATSHEIKCQHCLNYEYNPSEASQVISDILKNDPRSVYRRQKCSDRLYYFCIECLHVTCWFDENIAEVLRVRPAYAVIQCNRQSSL